MPLRASFAISQAQLYSSNVTYVGALQSYSSVVTHLCMFEMRSSRIMEGKYVLIRAVKTKSGIETAPQQFRGAHYQARW